MCTLTVPVHGLSKTSTFENDGKVEPRILDNAYYDMSTCQICRELWQLLTVPSDSYREINLGSFDEALASPCPDHTPIIERFHQHCARHSRHSFGVSNDVGFQRHNAVGDTTLRQSIKKGGLFYDLLLAKRPDVVDHPGKGRLLDSHWADLDVIKNWKDCCLSSHGETCENPMKITFATPQWLVDVDKQSIVRGGEGKRYVALSYRHGKASPYRVHVEALETLQQDHALMRPGISSQIPLIIRHAIAIAAAIGERYLWTDALCIVHSDRTAISGQLNLMGAIYGSAVITIISLDGDSSDGLPGFKGISQPRDLIQTVSTFGTEKIIVRNTSIFSMYSGGEYHDRAWTYQEFSMAPRRLLFRKNEFHWTCQCCVWHEELVPGVEVKSYIDPRLRTLAAGFPDPNSLYHMLNGYNCRDLTYDEDAFAAISGLLTVLSRTFHGGFLYGIPEMFFECALGWTPMWSHTILRRREASVDSAHTRVTASNLPSWSWIGWQGMFSVKDGNDVRVNDRRSSFTEVSPTTIWYTSSAPEGRPRRRIQPTWYEVRDRGKDENQPLPQGWSRHKAPVTGSFRGEPMLFPDECGQYIYKHDRMPDPDCDTWYYPFPVVDAQPSTPAFNP